MTNTIHHKITACLLVLFYFFIHDSLAQQDSLDTDPLLLQEVVITEHLSRSKLLTPSSIHSISGQDLDLFQGTAAAMQKIPGQFVDASTGEVFTRVHTRGISLSAEDDIGWYYSSLQEDGLPVTAIQYNQFSPDFFFRPDLSVRKLEAIRGGKSAIMSSNSPGVLINFATKQIDSVYTSHDRLTFGLYDNDHILARIEGRSGGPMGKNGWYHQLSYLYRYDQGPKDLDYSLNEGGQFKIGATKLLKNGVFSLDIKYLNDKVNRLTGVAAVGWADPEPAFNQSFSSTSLLPPSLAVSLPDGRHADGTVYEYDPSAGIRAKDLVFRVDFDHTLGPWSLRSKTKYSNKSLDWQTAIGGQPLGLEDFLTYFISGDEFPVGLIQFNDAKTGRPIATVDNTGILAAFQGLPPSFEYVDGRLPFDSVMGSGTWKKDDKIKEFIQDILIQRTFENSVLVLGTMNSFSSLNIFTTASFLYSTYEPSTRLLQVILNNPDAPSRLLSDPNGISNYGALLFQSADLNIVQNAVYGRMNTSITDKTIIDGGFRLERIHHSGTKSLFGPLNRNGGFDGDVLTSYDNGVLQTTGLDDISYTYTFISYSLGINHTISDKTTIYTRYSNGNKSPEVNFYINNFSNVEVPAKGVVQDVEQLEAGVKHLSAGASFSISGFFSRLNNVPFSEFVFDSDLNSIFYSPTLLNSSENIGLEFESYIELNKYFSLSVDLTLQQSNLRAYQLYRTNGTITSQDDFSDDFSGNRVPHNAPFMKSTTVSYKRNVFKWDITWDHMGSRFGNVENSFKMNSYNTVSSSVHVDLTSNLYVGLSANNVLNTGGIINFFGPNVFGGNANQATENFINANPDASFVVFPIMPRVFYFSLGYKFTK